MIAALELWLGEAGSLAATVLLHGTALAVVTWILCKTVLRRARPAVVAALWTLVLLKFVVPVGPELPVSLSGAVDGLLAADAAAPPPELTAEVLVQPVSAPVAAPVSLSWLLVELGILAVYLGGLLLVAGRRIARHRRARRAAEALPPVGAELAAALARAADTVGLRRLPRAVVSDDAASPFLLGVVRPILVIPSWLRGDELAAALVHELAHVRRRDHWSRGLQLAVGTLLYFFPVVAFVSRRLDVAREMACDDWVVARGALAPRAYAQVLVSLVKRGRGRATCAAAVGFTGRRHQLEERVEHLLSSGRRRPSIGPVAAVALAGWALVSLGGTADAAPPLIQRGGECIIDDGLIEQIMVTYPEADLDGDGVLSRAELCAHQERMKRRLVDEAFDGLEPARALDVAVRVDPAADADGNGILDALELDRIKSRVATGLDTDALSLDPVAFPGNICEEGPASCIDAPEVGVPASFPGE